MSSLTLTSWKCERCGLEVTTEHADSAPWGWAMVESDGKELDLCAECHYRFEHEFMLNVDCPPYAHP